MRLGWCLSFVVLLWTATVSGGQTTQAPAGKPIFKSQIDRVTISAVVRDQKGRIVPNLAQKDFEVLDAGRLSPITDFRADEAPVTIAVLLDSSGSMQVASKLIEAQLAADHVISWLQPGRDEVALFSFDRQLEQILDFTRNNVSARGGFGGVEAWGMTSLHDAIAETARRVAARGGSHRAVVVLTDGVDTSSRLTSAQVSGVASSIDVPVYIIAVVSPLDDPVAAGTVVPKPAAMPTGSLTDLAEWTGGELFVTSAPAQASLAARKIVDELRHQYLLAFEPGGHPGWHPLEVRARDRKMTVRARSGYFAGNS
jgi:Ca-activated chloride channel family protein